MAAYVVVEIEITDPAGFEEYRRLVPPTIARFGGRYVVRGGTCETLEGTWCPKRFVMLEFDSVEQAKKWWASPEYAEAKALRQRSAKSEIFVVPGV